jgi:hypothetical protein
MDGQRAFSCAGIVNLFVYPRKTGTRIDACFVVVLCPLARLNPSHSSSEAWAIHLCPQRAFSLCAGTVVFRQPIIVLVPLKPLLGAKNVRRCPNCHLEIPRGENECLRCGTEIESRDYFWWIILVAICGIGLLTFGVHQMLNR